MSAPLDQMVAMVVIAVLVLAMFGPWPPRGSGGMA